MVLFRARRRPGFRLDAHQGLVLPGSFLGRGAQGLAEGRRTLYYLSSWGHGDGRTGLTARATSSTPGAATADVVSVI